MLERYGNIWDYLDECGLLVFTANSFVKKNQCLAMGRGIAREVRDKIGGIDKDFGAAVLQDCGHLGCFGLIIIENCIAAFQTKVHFKDPSDLDVILYATELLKQYAIRNPERKIYMTYPGINNGGLRAGDVFPIIEVLPDNVTVWTYK